MNPHIYVCLYICTYTYVSPDIRTGCTWVTRVHIHLVVDTRPTLNDTLDLYLYAIHPNTHTEREEKDAYPANEPGLLEY